MRALVCLPTTQIGREGWKEGETRSHPLSLSHLNVISHRFSIRYRSIFIVNIYILYTVYINVLSYLGFDVGINLCSGGEYKDQWTGKRDS